MSIATANTFDTAITLRAPRKAGKTGLVIGLGLTAFALIPLAIAAFGISRGGLEAYMVLAAVMLG